MLVCVIDGRGGGLGSLLIKRLGAVLHDTHRVVAMGTNTEAATAMSKAGAKHVVVGEIAIRQTLHEADVIVGSLSMVLPGAMLGQVTPEMAQAILRAPCPKLLLPLNRMGVEVIGVVSPTLNPLIDEVIERVVSILQSPCSA
ncbi:MAG: DUF3842 family protein [Nitrospiraceae bacterium]|nr:DUF3842 family protein [Nitrospiraceae bacterium]